MAKNISNDAINVSNLVKNYRDRRSGNIKEALKGVSLTIPKGSVYGLLGPNGAGKSTFINILAGLTLKTSGKVIIDGTNQDENPKKTRHSIGVVPQELVLDPFFPVAEMLEYYAGYYAVPKEKRRTQEIIDALSLTDKAKTPPRKLSGGMRRRVLVAKALVHSPPILILDEPTAGVDVELRSQLWEYVRKLNKQGTTILLTTHYLEEAEQLCDYIAVINHGSIIANDRTKTLLSLLDYKELTITFEKPLKKIPSELMNYTPVLDEAKTSLSLRYQQGKLPMEALLYFTKTSNASIKDLTTKQPDLEEIFKHLIASNP